MQKTFTFYSDPGHGWMKVHRQDLRTLGLILKISPYSYMRGDYAYLEEDLDASVFIEAFRQTFGETPKFREENTNKYSKIRGYDHYSAEVFNG